MKPASVIVPFLVVCSAIGLATVVAVPAEPGGEPPAGGMGDPTEATPEAELTPEEKARYARFVKRFREGQRLMGSGKDAEAEKILTELRDEEPEAAAVHHALAIVFRYQGKPEESGKSFAEAARLAPADPVIQRDTGEDLLAKGHAVEAERYYAAAHKLWPEDMETLVGHGNALRTVGRLADAEKTFREAVAQEANSVDAQVGLAGCLVFRDPAEALKIAQALPPHFVDVSLVLGLAFERLERFDEAVTALVHAAEVAPAGAPGLAFLRQSTEALVRCGRPVEAAKAAGKWSRADRKLDRPGFRSAFSLALSQAAVGDGDAAIATLDGVFAGKQIPAEVYRHASLFRAAVFLRLGKPGRAHTALEALAGPDSKEFEHLAARRILGVLSAEQFAAVEHSEGRANDVAWVEAMAAQVAGDPEAAKAHSERAAALSKPPGEYPGLLVQPPGTK